jgi:translation initiation factor IF-3
MDYGKFKYESAVKARESRKNQTQTIVKEIKLRPKIDPHDYGTKKGHVERFLKAGDKVKVTIMFRGREQSRPELGFRLLQKLADDVQELGFVESQAKQDGRNMIMVIGPHKRAPERKPESKLDRPPLVEAPLEDEPLAEEPLVDESLVDESLADEPLADEPLAAAPQEAQPRPVPSPRKAAPVASTVDTAVEAPAPASSDA